MIIKTVNGVDIDTDSPEYQRYLRLLAIDEAHPDISDPAPYRTLGDVVELERRRRECEAREASQNRVPQDVRETAPI
ncbi:MAG: hypothetical protein H7145_15675 [Akkermansiaceae bacterium]|nr:hypothetical protein [Armatimonadota bacterium]